MLKYDGNDMDADLLRAADLCNQGAGERTLEPIIQARHLIDKVLWYIRREREQQEKKR